MSTEIDARFWNEKHSLSVGEKFSQIINAVSSWSQATHEWQGLRVVDRTINNVVIDIPGSISLSELQKAVEDYDGSTLRLSTGIRFKCWRFSERRAERGFLRLQVESWGHDYASRNGRDWQIEGDASLSIKTCGPYCALLDCESDPEEREINRCVEENLEDLTDLLLRTVDSSQPNAMKVFTDAGAFLLFSVHLAYYRAQSGIARDIQHLAQIWEQGLPTYNIPPLKLLDPEHEDFVFHPWRDSQSRRDLWINFSSAISKMTSVSSETISRILISGRFDTYEMPVGVTVLEYPYFLNAFLDRFYLEILNAADV